MRALAALLLLASFAAAEEPLALWDGKSKLVCTGDQVMSIDGQKAHLAGTAITASGRCQLTLTRCEIDAGVAVRASGNASVTVENGTLHGSYAAVSASGRARVVLRNVAVEGPVKVSGDAHVAR
jgi:hypothetical protein